MSINFYNKSLKRWKDSHHEDVKMESVFRSGMITISETLQNMKNQIFGISSNPQIEAKAALLSIVDAFDKLGHSTRLLVQNQAQTRALTIDILDDAYEAPSLEISKVSEDFDMGSKQASIGPIIPVRYTYSIKRDVDEREMLENFTKSFSDISLANKSIKDNKFNGVEIEDESIEIIFNWLESAAKNLDKDCLDRFSKSPLSRHKFKMSYLHIIETQHSVKTSKVSKMNSSCANPNCTNVSSTSIMVCSVCRTPYCSRQCQKEDW